MTTAYIRCLPVLLAFQQLAVGSDLQLKTHFSVDDRLQFPHDRIHLGLQCVRLSPQRRILSLQFTFSSLLGAPQRRDLAGKLRVLQVIALFTQLEKTYPAVIQL